MPWYKQTAVWGVIISVLAIVLTQLPPVSNWRARNIIHVELGKRVGLPNTIGIPGYQLFVDLHNKGNRTIDLSKLRLRITYPNNTSKILLAQTYQKITPGQFAPLDFPITSISLSPETSWSELVAFYQELSPEDDETLLIFRFQISKSINDKQQQSMHTGAPIMGPVEADPLIVEQAVKFFDKKFDLEKGESISRFEWC